MPESIEMIQALQKHLLDLKAASRPLADAMRRRNMKELGPGREAAVHDVWC
jgi:hypothetical protein